MKQREGLEETNSVLPFGGVTLCHLTHTVVVNERDKNSKSVIAPNDNHEFKVHADLAHYLLLNNSYTT